jgi:hypothetical protein
MVGRPEPGSKLLIFLEPMKTVVMVFDEHVGASQ